MAERSGIGKVNLGATQGKHDSAAVDIIMSETDPTMDNNGMDEQDGYEEEAEPNIVRIGKKPTMNYVVACVTLFNSGVPDVMVRARGQSITKAVETVEMLRRAFFKNVKIESVDIGTEDVQRDDGSTTSLSTIEIILGATSR
jgi:DNA-binding protein Alba